MFSTVLSFLMRTYRKSPLHPRLGKPLALLLSLVTRLRSKKQVIREIDGVTFELNLEEVIDSSLYYSGTFEAEAEAVLETLVQPGMVAVDIGANFGYHTFRMARSAGANGRVLAIEPTTWAYDKLQRNAALNPAIANIDYAKVGLSDTVVGETEIAFVSSYRLDGAQTSRPETVRLTTLDALVEELHLPRVDFIKLDVDGFEGRVLHGAERTLTQYRPVIFFELTPAAVATTGYEAIALLRWLESLGYALQSEQRQPIKDVAAFCHDITGGFSVNMLAIPAAGVQDAAA
jgi:FkbM family methyltransferase